MEQSRSCSTPYAPRCLNTYREAGVYRCVITEANPAVHVNLRGIEEHHAVMNTLLADVLQIHVAIIQWAPARRANQAVLSCGILQSQRFWCHHLFWIRYCLSGSSALEDLVVQHSSTSGLTALSKSTENSTKRGVPSGRRSLPGGYGSWKSERWYRVMETLKGSPEPCNSATPSLWRAVVRIFHLVAACRIAHKSPTPSSTM